MSNAGKRGGGLFQAWPTSENQNEVFYIMHSAADNFGKLKGVGMELTKNQELIVKTTTATCQASVQLEA